MEIEKKVVQTLFYNGVEGAIIEDFIIDDENETLWATQKTISNLFNIDRTVITKHLKNIFDDEELDKNSVCAKIAHTASDGKIYKTNFYNLDAMISVGYRVNSKEATQFRKWATSILKQYMVRGYVLDKELLKNDGRFSVKYFEYLLEDIREIRASERKFNQKILDIYSTSYDYNKDAEVTEEFFATVQNKLIYGVTGSTAAEIIANRSDSKKEYMGLTSWRTQKGKIVLSDVVISKNYLTKKELDNLNRIVEAFLNVAEYRALNEIVTTMNDWKEFLEGFIKLNQLKVLHGKGSIDSASAKEIAIKEYKKFKIIQDKNYQSYFDEIIEEIKRIEGENN